MLRVISLRLAGAAALLFAALSLAGAARAASVVSPVARSSSRARAAQGSADSRWTVASAAPRYRRAWSAKGSPS